MKIYIISIKIIKILCLILESKFENDHDICLRYFDEYLYFKILKLFNKYKKKKPMFKVFNWQLTLQILIKERIIYNKNEIILTD